MIIRNATILILIIGIVTCLTGVTVAEDTKNPVRNISEIVNVSAADSDINDNQTGNNVSATISWVDKTTVSGKITNFFKGFSYQSGINV